MFLPQLKLPPWYGGQMGVPGSDTPLGLRTAAQGNVYYVDNTHPDASATADGTDPNAPLTTIDGAIGKCTNNHHDIIIVGAGHAEAVATAAAINCDVAGIHILGLGTGQDRPRLTFTDVAATVAIGAVNVTLENLLFLVGVDALAIMVDVNADDCTLVNCEFRENTAVAQQWLTAVDVNGGGANAADRARILGCKFMSEAAGANHAIEIGAVADGIEIVGNWITGNFAVAGIHSDSVLTNLLLAGNYVRNVNAGNFAVELTDAATGMAVGNRLYSNALVTCFDPGSLMCADNLATDAIDEAAVPIPATAAGPLPAGSIDADTIADDAINANTFAAGAIDADAIADDALDTGAFTNDALGQAAYGIIVERAAAALPQTDSQNLFTVAGGQVLLKSLIGIATAQIGAVANAVDLLHGATTITGNTTDVNGDAVGTRYSLTGTFADDVVKTAVGVPVARQATEIVLPAGNVVLRCAASDGGGGRVQWTAVYVPLNLGATLVAA